MNRRQFLNSTAGVLAGLLGLGLVPRREPSPEAIAVWQPGVWIGFGGARVGVFDDGTAFCSDVYRILSVDAESGRITIG